MHTGGIATFPLQVRCVRPYVRHLDARLGHDRAVREASSSTSRQMRRPRTPLVNREKEVQVSMMASNFWARPILGTLPSASLPRFEDGCGLCEDGFESLRWRDTTLRPANPMFKWRLLGRCTNRCAEGFLRRG